MVVSQICALHRKSNTFGCFTKTSFLFSQQNYLQFGAKTGRILEWNSAREKESGSRLHASGRCWVSALGSSNIHFLGLSCTLLYEPIKSHLNDLYTRLYVSLGSDLIKTGHNATTVPNGESFPMGSTSASCRINGSATWTPTPSSGKNPRQGWTAGDPMLPLWTHIVQETFADVISFKFRSCSVDQEPVDSDEEQPTYRKTYKQQ